MDSVELSKTLRESARQKGLCDTWYNKWKDNTSNESLVAKMYKGLDFVLKHHWPSNAFIKENFSQDFLRESHVFVDDKHSVVNPNQSLVLGDSEITFRYNAAGHGEIHIRDNSSVKLSAKNRSFVIVHLYENAHIEAIQSDTATLTLIKHSHDVSVVTDGNVTVKEEYDYLK